MGTKRMRTTQHAKYLILLSLFVNFSYVLLIDENEASDDAVDEQIDEDIPVKRSGTLTIINPDTLKSFNAYENFRQLIRSQRWKKSKIDMYRPAYGFGKKKRNADMNFDFLSPYSYGSRFMSNPYSDLLMPYF